MAEAYIEIMLQSLKKKEQVLEQIVILNKKQRNVLENPDSTPDEFDVLVEQKGTLIEQLEQLDSGFEKLFHRMKDELDENREAYAAQIKELQGYIRSVTDKSVEIQAQEARNKDLMAKRFSSVRQQVKTVRTGTQVVNKYYQTMTKNMGYVDPQFMDNKK